MVDFKKIELNQDIKLFLAPAMANDPLNSINSVIQDIERGVCQLIGGFIDDKLTLAFVIRIDVGELGKELVVVVGASSVYGGTSLSIPYFEKIARQEGCEYIRIHTAKKALAKILVKNGFEVSELVVRKRV